MAGVIVSPSQKAFVIPYREDVQRCVPNAKRLSYGGKDLLAMPHTDDAVVLLRNLGVAVPETIRYFYDWGMVAPFDAQIETAAMLSTHPRAYVLNDMGTGKTRSAIYAYDYLRQLGRVKKMLVIAPLSTLKSVWEGEVFQYFPHLSCGILYGTKAKRLKVLSEPHDIYVVNHDGVKVLKEALQARSDIDVIVIDELAVYRTQRTNRWRSLRDILLKRKYVWGLTGQPTPNEPTDAWAQCRLITPESVPKHFMQFRDLTMTKVTQFKWVPKSIATKVVHEAMQPSVRFTRDDCVDLPPVSYTTREVDLTPAQRKAEKELIDKFRVEFEQGQVTAANEGVKLGKLLQVASGFAYLDDGPPVRLPVKERMAALDELVEEAPAKVLVFAPFIELVDIVASHLKQRYSVATVTGATAAGERHKIFSKFQHSSEYDIIVAHPGTMAHGLTLTAACLIVWASPPQSLEIYEQANARITRPSQTRNQLIAHIQSSKTEARVYERLTKRAKLQGLLLDMFQGVQHY